MSTSEIVPGTPLLPVTGKPSLGAEPFRPVQHEAAQARRATEPAAGLYDSASGLNATFCLFGQGVSQGYAIGRAVVMSPASVEVAHYLLLDHELEAEQQRLLKAVEQTVNDLHQMARALPEDSPRELASLLSVHALLLQDPFLIDSVCQLITQHRYNAEWALSVQGQILGEQFAQMQDDYLRERGTDVRQVIERVLRVLSGTSQWLPNLDALEGDAGFIVVARDISPADMMRLRSGSFSGFLTDLGGTTSHTAIVARSLGVPAVLGLGMARNLLRDGDMLLVDGSQGMVLVNPGPAALEEYRGRQAALQRQKARLKAMRHAPAITLDGVAVDLEANIELPEEAHQAMAHGAAGIGLFRTEFLFLGRNDLPDEDEQYEAYAMALRIMRGRPVTFRSLDVGADKALPGDEAPSCNPALGLRAIRYSLANPDMFHTQLRAIMRAAAHGPVRLLLPMISQARELHAARQAMRRASEELRDQRMRFDDNLLFGAMVEIPAMAIAIEAFLPVLDFLSIGTNDLIQYVLAIDRGDQEVAALYDPLHPAVLRLIAHTINAGKRAGKPVAVCGEMAGDLRLTRLLLGLGLTGFSMHPELLLEVKSIIRQSHSQELRRRLAGVLNHAERIDLANL